MNTFLEIAVGSTNRDKIGAVSNAFSAAGYSVIVSATKAKSGVAEQPTSLNEMFQGVVNRADEAGRKNKGAPPVDRH